MKTLKQRIKETSPWHVVIFITFVLVAMGHNPFFAFVEAFFITMALQIIIGLFAGIALILTYMLE